tara:strand:+ start:4183 stop:4632 length:450 start_codon:yes stop_codon:yes gene_type:complete
MAIRHKARSTTAVSWADSVNNNATFNNTWQITEYAKVSIASLDLAYSTGNNVGVKIEEIIFTGTGTTPATASKKDTEILIATDSGFTNVICVHTGLFSDAKYNTTKCVAAFDIGHYIVVDNSTDLYITVKCGGSGALTADAIRLTASQS